MYAANAQLSDLDRGVLILAGTAYDPATRQDTLTRIAKAWF